MEKLYSSPFRLLIIVTLLTTLGALAGLRLPISLFPNSSKPTIWVGMSYGTLNTDEFVSLYGSRVESVLGGLSSPGLEVEKVISDYSRNRVNYQVEFGWGADPKEAIREIQTSINGITASFPREIRDSVGVNFWSRSSGMIAITFFSPSLSLEELFKVLEPAIMPRLALVSDADNPSLWNPARKEIKIEPRMEIMAGLGLFPRDIERALERGLEGYVGGTLQVGTNSLQIQMPRRLETLRDLGSLLVTTPSGRQVHLSEVAHIDLSEAIESNQVFKTNSTKSIILIATPRSGANVKEMSERIIDLVDDVMTTLPSDIEYRLIVDPSEFIRSSIRNVTKEVILAALIAALVLFVFIGSVRNTITAAFEIPLSMILAFLMMYLFEMNINLISLGGLALAAGMNVDAAVVVMENIFRHIQKHPNVQSIQDRSKLVAKAVAEVRLPIIASTLSTLVVFGPLMFTQNLTNAILGDLAKAVVFSHSFALLVALFVVPTVRLGLMNRGQAGYPIPVSPINKPLLQLEKTYESILRFFLGNKRAVVLLLVGVPVVGLLLFSFALPRLEREIIGKPDTDWLIVGINTQGNTLISQMETISGELEVDLLEHFGHEIQYTFNQIQRPNNATLMLRLNNKRDMERVQGDIENHLQNTPDVFYWVGSWNPAELPIPEFSDFKLVLRGGSLQDRTSLAEDVMTSLQEHEIYSRFSSRPGLRRQEQVVVVPHYERWSPLVELGANFSPYDLLDLMRVITQGKPYRTVPLADEEFMITLRYPLGEFNSVESLRGIPLRVGEKVVPLAAVADIYVDREPPSLYRKNGAELIIIEGTQNKSDRANMKEREAQARSFIEEYLASDPHARLELKTNPMLAIEDSREELTQAMGQASSALIASIILIFFTLLFQFTSIPHTLIVMSAIPFALVGGTLSLFIFQSPLSLNAALGIILLNGIAVNNSIMLVDFIRRFKREGYDDLTAIIEASKSRLRPILITSLTTIIGMLPIALGQGDGGKILQPLGVAVCGGLWLSMLFTLIFVPILESLYYRTMKGEGAKEEQNLKKSVPLGRAPTIGDSEEAEVLQ